MPKDPSNFKQVKVPTQFMNGLAVGDTKLTGEAMTNIAAVAEMDEADLAAIEDAAELAAAVGTYEGEDDIATDLAAVVTKTTRTAILEIDAVPTPLTVAVPTKCAGVNIDIVDGGDTNTIELTLDDDAINVGDTIPVIVSLTADSGTACVIDIVHGTASTISSAANGTYLFYCAAEGEWICVVQPAQA